MDFVKGCVLSHNREKNRLKLSESMMHIVNFPKQVQCITNTVNSILKKEKNYKELIQGMMKII